MKSRHCILFLAVSLIAGNVFAAGKLEDWPRFLGPRGDGTSLETGLLDSFPQDGPPLVWEKQIGTGYSAPSVWDEKLVLHHREGNQSLVDCLDAATGKLIWRQGYDTHYVDPYGYNNGPRCTPLIAGARVYTYGAEGMLHCLNMKDGSVVWTRNTRGDWKAPQAFFGVGTTPILEGGKLIVMVGGQPNSGMVALDPATGKTLWESVGADTWDGRPKVGFPGEPPVIWQGSEKMTSYSTPTAATVHGKRYLFCLMRQGLVALDPETGKVRFSRFFRARVNESVNAINPVVVDDLVFISAAYYGVGSVLLQVDQEGNGYREVWSTYQRRKQNRRHPPVLEIHWTTPIYHDGHLYAFSGRNEPDARFRCVELKTGKLKWDRDERWAKYASKQPGKYGRGSAVMADGKLIVLGEGGLLGLFKVDPSKPVELARWQVPALHYPCWAAPVLSHRRVYLRSENRLLCYDFSARE